MISKHQPDENAKIQECVQSVNRMLDICNTRHTTCKADDMQQSLSGLDTPRFTPKRLLHVVRQNDCLKVLLCETGSGGTSLKGTGFRYTALSHCWGSTPIVKTTTATASAFMAEGICWDALPKTFQEAVLLTHELGVPYIWIDSLCKCLRAISHLIIYTELYHSYRHSTRLCSRLG